MASLRYWRCAALLLLLALAGARGQQEEAEEEPLDELFDEPSTPEGPVPPHLLVWKRVLPNATDPVVGSTLTAHFYIQNVGESPAFDVELKDAPWSGSAVKEKAGAETKVYFKEIAAGASATHAYSLSAVEAGPFAGNPALVTYRSSPSSGTADWSALSTFVEKRFIISRSSAFCGFLLKVGKYASLGVLRTREAWQNTLVFVAVVGGALGVNKAILVTRRASKIARQRAAEASLMKDK